MSHVSRSVYQKLKEENKRLLHDLYMLTMEPGTKEGLQIMLKWYKKFRTKQEFNEAIRELITGKFK